MSRGVPGLACADCPLHGRSARAGWAATWVPLQAAHPLGPSLGLFLGATDPVPSATFTL